MFLYYLPQVLLSQEAFPKGLRPQINPLGLWYHKRCDRDTSNSQNYRGPNMCQTLSRIPFSFVLAGGTWVAQWVERQTLDFSS